MKKLITATAATVVLAVAVNAQTYDANTEKDIANISERQAHFSLVKNANKKEMKNKTVSYFSREEFYRNFGNIGPVSWAKTSNFEEATFYKNGMNMTAFYDADSKLVGTITDKKFTDLPENAQKTISKKYKDYSVAGVSFFDDNEYNETDMILYDTQLEGADNYFAELTKDNTKIVVQVNMLGQVIFFKAL